MKMIVSRPGNGHYSPGVMSQGTLYVSGQLPIDPSTGSIPEDVESQVAVALANVDCVLQEAGLTRDNVMLCHVYVSDIEKWESVDRAYAAFFGNHRPARVVVPAGKLHFGACVEIEAIAET